ncbi:hypothetical protein QA641_24725 [Bradyrhizobium sp. CB1650]|uniref:hypothetical protein n=1 Tax=Bradyrhizobium sp. CB1650 TaxID=3039153 RepID=UPI0024353115|nr:hypothetical protein [Bradyrhizobium sp. CB1650]WGD48847.1 hypothetical protein QA641_24725 [Bradyrhizobium sp. CB1650]
MPIIVYLDSSDFSDLSHDETSLSDANQAILKELRLRMLDGSVEFPLSGVHLSEAVHASDNPDHKQAAVRRATLMQELCAGNHLRLPPEIMRLEIAKAMDGAQDARLSKAELFSGNSEWFGLSLAKTFKPSREGAMARIDQHLTHLPRRERRKIKSELKPSTSRGRARLRELLRSSHATPQEFPFSLLTNEFVLDWLVGDRSDNEFRDKLTQVLNNPKGLIESVLDLTNERQTIYSLLRDRGENNCTTMQRALQPLLNVLSELDPAEDFSVASRAFRNATKQLRFGRIIVSEFADYSVDHLDDKSIDRLVAACPAISTFVNLYTAYALSLIDSTLQRWRSGKNSIKEILPSDFGDMMHSAYAPYSDIFRCDAHFASLLSHNRALKGRVAGRSRLRALSNSLAA